MSSGVSCSPERYVSATSGGGFLCPLLALRPARPQAGLLAYSEVFSDTRLEKLATRSKGKSPGRILRSLESGRAPSRASLRGSDQAVLTESSEQQ
jgi:hypothetical protein